MEVPANVINAFKEWNTKADRNTADYDTRMIRALLLLCTEIENVSQQEIAEFVLGK